jgi:hypothetical protein
VTRGQHEGSDVTVNAPGTLLGPGVTFDWITFGARIRCTVHEFEPAARIGWHGETDQWLAYHTWLLQPSAREPPTSSWRRPASAPARRDSPTPIPGTCTAATTCGNISLKFLCEG